MPHDHVRIRGSAFPARENAGGLVAIPRAIHTVRYRIESVLRAHVPHRELIDPADNQYVSLSAFLFSGGIAISTLYHEVSR